METDSRSETPDTFLKALKRKASMAAHEIVAYDHQGTGEWQPVTSSEYWSLVQKGAQFFLKEGLQPGESVAIILPGGFQWEWIEKAIHLARGLSIGIELIAAESLALSVVRRCQTRFVLSSSFGERDLLDRLLAYVKDAKIESELAIPSGDTLSHLVLSSGTSGEPKILAYTQAQVWQASLKIKNQLNFPVKHCRSLSWLPMANLFQRIVNLCVFAQGGVSYYIPDPLKVMAMAKTVRPDFLVGIPKLFDQIHQNIEVFFWRKFWLSPLRALLTPLILRKALGGRIRFAISGSALLLPRTEKFFRKNRVPLLNAYGMSECVLPVAMNTLNSWRVGSVGKAMDSIELRHNSDQTLSIRSPFLSQGYWADGRLAKLADEEGFFHTEDLIEVDGDGFLYHHGRLSDIAKASSGRKISLLQIEDALRRSRGVDEIVALADGRNRPVVLIRNPSQQELYLQREQVREAIVNAAQELPSFERPSAALFIETGLSITSGDFTPNMKLKRRMIENKYKSLLSECEHRAQNIDDNFLSGQGFLYIKLEKTNTNIQEQGE